METEQRVFIPQISLRYVAETQSFRPAFNFSPAAQFGTLTPILEPDDDPLMIARITDKVKRALADYKETDYFLATGNPTVIAICAGVIMRKHSVLQMLQWDKQLKAYLPLRCVV
jgi:hypothetical protein